MSVIDDELLVASDTAVRDRGRLRRVGGWALIALLVIGVALFGLRFAASAPASTGGLDPEGRRDFGALALAEILRDRGVQVDVFRSRAAAADAVDEDSTLVMSNPYTLTDEALTTLIDPADRVVFLSSGSHLLELLGIGTSSTASSGPVSADCDVPEFARVGEIRPDGLLLPDDGVTACFGTASEGAAVLVDERGDRRISVVNGSALFRNEYLAEDGNAALALALLGQTERVVWYVPNWDDSDVEGEAPQTLASLTPPWVTPAILLLLLSGIAAAVWKGRRFGPLVSETLPVTVRASETMHGRARLTAKAADAPHAAEALRDGARRRLARRLGLAAGARVDEVADAAADRLRIPRGSLQDLLAGSPPSDDAELVELARRLSELEDAVHRTTRTPGAST